MDIENDMHFSNLFEVLSGGDSVDEVPKRESDGKLLLPQSVLCYSKSTKQRILELAGSDDFEIDDERDCVWIDDPRHNNYPFHLLDEYDEAGRYDLVQKRAQKYLDKRWSNNENDALERAEKEIMSPEKHKVYSKIAQFISDKYSVKLTWNNVDVSTNRYGEHSWYITIPNVEFNPDYDWEYDEGIETEEFITFKITDHLNGYLYTRSNRDSEGFIVDTYCVDEDEDFSVVRVVDTFVNKSLDTTGPDDGRIYKEISLDDLGKVDLDDIEAIYPGS